MKKRVLFLCTGNSCRSQMAEGLGKSLWNQKIEWYSAGIEKHGLNPLAVKAMEEIGIDINKVQLIRKLQNVYVPPSNYDISPFMVYTENELKFIKDTNEVKEIINVDLEQLFIDNNIVKTKGSQISNRYLNTLVPAYKLNGYFVWGATAMILSEVKDIIKSVL